MLCIQWVIGHLFLFLLSKISISTLEKYYSFISLSTLEARDQNFNKVWEGQRLGPIERTFRSPVSISALGNFYFYSRKIWFFISLSTLEARDQNFEFLFPLSIFLSRARLSSMPGCQLKISRLPLFKKPSSGTDHGDFSGGNKVCTFLARKYAGHMF